MLLCGIILRIKKKSNRETWMANELAVILHKLDRNAEERADERERKRLLIEKEEDRKTSFRS